jgi:hypothetical protein
VAVPVGFTLQPDAAFLELCAPLIEDADYYEVTPETLWRLGRDGELTPNGFHRRFLEIKAETGKPFVAHGVGLSMGTSDRSDAARRRRWLRQMCADQAAFGFGWYTEHLGASSLAGLAMTLPLPVPMDAAAAKVLRGRLRAMQQVVPDVGVENNVAYFTLGAPLEEPGFLRRVLSAPRTHLLLDLHNLHTMAVNFGFDPEEYLNGLPLDRVIEIHMSGGSFSDGAWLPSGRVMRLDSHAGAVPEEVWRLLGCALPRCPNLRGVTLERMEGTVEAEDIRGLHEELHRIRACVSP